MSDRAAKRKRLTESEQSKLLADFYENWDGDAEDEFIDNIDGEEDDETVMEIVENAVENGEDHPQEVDFSVELPRKQRFNNLDEVLDTSNFTNIASQADKTFVYQKCCYGQEKRVN